jgi:nucleoside-diphosphate-sugar epimerase
MLACALAIEFGLSLEVVRPFHVYGIGEHPDRFWPSLRSAALSGRDFEMTDGLQVRDFIDVVDVANEILKSVEGLMEALPGVTIRNIGSGSPQSLIEFARKCWEKFDATGRLVPGAVMGRPNEVNRYAACLKPVHFSSK